MGHPTGHPMERPIDNRVDPISHTTGHAATSLNIVWNVPNMYFGKSSHASACGRSIFLLGAPWYVARMTMHPIMVESCDVPCDGPWEGIMPVEHAIGRPTG